MATKVFTGADITLSSVNAIDSNWTAAATAWMTGANVNNDSGTVANGSGSAGGLRVNATLVDDLAIPASIRVANARVEFDWHVVNSGGAGGGGHDDSTLASIGPPVPVPVTQLANTDTTGHYSSITPISAGMTRAALFTVGEFGFIFAAPQRTGANSSQIVVTNFTVTITYVNTGTGSWLVRVAQMANPTGDTDFVSFAPDIAQMTSPNQLGGIDIPIADTAGAFIYLDGGGSPVDVAGLPAGFTPDDGFFVHDISLVNFVGDSVDATLAPLVDVLINAPNTSNTLVDFAQTGMTLVQLGALVGGHFTGTMTTGTDPTVGALRIAIQSVAVWDPDQSFGVWGTYTIGAGSVIRVNPPRGSVNGGQAVAITGTGFLSATGVTFGGTAATSVVIVSDTRITAVTPEHVSGLVDVEVLSVAIGTGLYTFVILPSFNLDPLPERTPIRQGDDPAQQGGGRGR